MQRPVISVLSSLQPALFRESSEVFHLFGGKVLRFSDLERVIPAISQKMLSQQLRQLEAYGIVRRIVRNQVPPNAEYCLTDWGQTLCPVLDALLKWAELREVKSRRCT